jgi:hypothetical protein
LKIWYCSRLLTDTDRPFYSSGDCNCVTCEQAGIDQLEQGLFSGHYNLPAGFRRCSIRLIACFVLHDAYI